MRPGELVQLDTTPLDVMALLEDGVPGRVELTIALDVCTRTICAAVLRPGGTKAVDAALLLARMLVPEPMRPGWSAALHMAVSRIPHARLLDLDARLEHAAAKPVIVPETVVTDRGRVFVSDTFVRACQRLGISVQPAHPGTPTDKGHVERTFAAINTLFCQHVAGYVGSNVTHRGARPATDAVWTLPQLQDLLDEWIIAGWQARPHDGLRDPHAGGRPLSPNEMFAAAIAATGYITMPLTRDDYLELLPVQWRAIGDHGVQVDYRHYDTAAFNPLRGQPSGVLGKGNRWEVHYDPYDLSHVYVRDPRTHTWIAAPWTHLPMIGQPFADFTWRAARQLVADRGGDDHDETAVAAALDNLLTRATAGPASTPAAAPGRGSVRPARQRRTAARTRASGPSIPETVIEPPAADLDDGTDDVQPYSAVTPFAVFEAGDERTYR
ncbi:Mu transposase C-terminal domain-containing protein [Dactylosporangium sp. CA-139114]|uniref:Mu transposase C-terminal domain-containing protein n=1 Tax=Dactylosporangium sp. CA-139114 TaxID=3239931 RepID=UPI003D95C23D